MGNCFKNVEETPSSLVDDKHGLLSRQRRRLSVTPKHVGNEIDNCDRRSSCVTNVNRSQSNTNCFGSEKQETGSLGHLSYAVVTKKGYVPYNRGKINQDSFVTSLDLGKGVSMWGVLDGHGDAGALVSEYIAKALHDLAEEYVASAEGEIDGGKMLTEVIQKSIQKMENESGIDTTFSGTTLVVSVIIGKKLWTANVGDSRAIVVQGDKTAVTAKALSRDHKPELPDECKRILASGGRVAKLPGPPTVDMGPMRVWLAEMDVPGLAMSRSIGDGIAHRAGVTSEAEITCHDLSSNDMLACWASDGVWEFLQNETVADIIHKGLYPKDGATGNLEGAGRDLVEKAVRKWCAEEDAIDDITALIVMTRPEEEKKEPEVVAPEPEEAKPEPEVPSKTPENEQED